MRECGDRDRQQSGGGEQHDGAADAAACGAAIAIAEQSLQAEVRERDHRGGADGDPGELEKPSTWLAGREHGSELDARGGDRVALKGVEVADAVGGKVDQAVHGRALEGTTFGGALDFDKTTVVGHDDVEVDLGA